MVALAVRTGAFIGALAPVVKRSLHGTRLMFRIELNRLRMESADISSDLRLANKS